MSADARVKSFIDRILRLKEEQDAIAADIREIYAEAKGEGYNKTAMGELVSYLRKVEKKGADAIEAQQGDFDLYLDAYQRASGMRVATRMHASARTAEMDRATEGSFETGSEAGESPAANSEPDLSSPDRSAEAVEFPTSDTASATSYVTPHSPVVDDGQPSTPSSDARPAQSDDEAEPLPSGGAAAAGSGYGQSEQAVASFKFKPVVLRPNCKRPENCGGYGSKHCAACERVGREVAAA